MKCRVFILLVLVSLLTGKASTTTPITWFGGTFIGAVVVEDGIILASDTRSTFIDNSGKQFGYIDGIPKVFVQHDAAFAVSGLSSVSGELFNSFVERNDFLLTRPVDEILFGVMLGLPFKNSNKVLLISAGFADGHAMICAKSPTEPQLCRNSGFITNRDSPSLSHWLTASRGLTPKAVDAASAMRQAILESSDHDVTIGGPISILHLRKMSEPEWLENPPNDHGWKTVCDIILDYRKGNARIQYSNSKEELDRSLNVTCPK